MRVKKGVVLLSGGIDSATTLYYARSRGYKVFCLTFDYGQRHGKEIRFAKSLAKGAHASWRLVKIRLPWKGSSLLDKRIRLPEGSSPRRGIPNTYVPGRNIIFLSYALSYAETIHAKGIFIGANQIDYSGYPDCRSIFLKSFEDAANKGTRQGAEGNRIGIIAPLIDKTKEGIIRTAIKLKVPLEQTWSCYSGGRRPCGKCDSCLIRQDGFKKIGRGDPLLDE